MKSTFRLNRFGTGSLVMLLLIVGLMASSCNPGPAAPAATSTPTPNPNFTLGILFNAKGSRRDGTFNEFAYIGAQLASKVYGVKLLPERETVEDKDYPFAIEALISQGANIVIAVGFQTQTAILEAAAKYPERYFIGVDQSPDKSPSNYVGVIFREDQGGFLAGTMAGMMTKSNVVGVLGGMEFPPVVRFVNGFINGVRYVNPQAKALSMYMGTFDEGAKGRATADSMIGEGADVLFNAAGLAGSVGIAHAAELGKFVIGVDQDEFRTTFKTGKDADRILTSAVKRVDTGVFNAVEDILKGQHKGGLLLLSAADCGITYAPFNSADKAIPATVKARQEAIWRALAGGTLTTGADGVSTATPVPLAAGANPPIAENAPKLSDCQ